MPSSLFTGQRHQNITWTNPSAAYQTDRSIFTAPYDCTIQSANCVFSVIGSDGGSVNIQLTKDTGTTAPGAGTDLLANNSNAGFDMKGTINVVQYASFKPGASRKLARGDRLSLDFSGTHTAVNGLTITVIINRS